MAFENGLEETAAVGVVLVYLVAMLLSGGMSIVLYVFRSWGMYHIAKRRGLNHPWMAWVPVLDSWILGSVSDQYQYVVKGKNKNKRKWLIGLYIAMAAVMVAFWILYIILIAGVVSAGVSGASETEMLSGMMGPLVALLVMALPMMGLGIAMTIIRYVALYDVYNSLVPSNSVMFLVLSILFSFTEPFFIFFNRKKDFGMPPRRTHQDSAPQEPVCAPHQNAYAVQSEPVAAEAPAEAAAPVTVEEAPVAEPAVEAPEVEEVPAAEPAAEVPAAEEAPVVEETPVEEVPAQEPAEPIILGAAVEEPYEELPEEPAEADPWDEE